MNYIGLIIGGVTFLAIGLFHPLVIKAEYYFGKRIWWVFLAMGIVFTALSLYATNGYASIILGVLACSSFWSIGEIIAQHERVRKGWFPMNPKRKADYM